MSEPAWGGFAASVRGPGHVRWDLPNQDAWRMVTKAGAEVLVVSDGMGSYRYAREGADACCRGVVAAATQWAPAAAPEAFLRLVHALWLFLIQPHSPEECHCTCLMAVRRQREFFLAQLGDGMVCVCGPDGNSLPFGLPEKEFSNVTEGLGRNFSLDPWKWTSIPVGDVSGILLATDGVADDLKEEHAGAFGKDILDAVLEDGPEAVEKQLTALLKDWPVPGHSDDKTIAGIFRRNRDA